MEVLWIGERRHAGALGLDAGQEEIILKRKMGVFVELALSEVFDFGFVWW